MKTAIMIADLMTETPAPATSMNTKGKGMVRRAAYRLSVPRGESALSARRRFVARKKKKPEMMPTLKPDMASMWEVPVWRKRSFSSR